MRLVALLVLVALQGMVGTVQFFTGVPAVLVAVHVARRSRLHGRDRSAMGVDATAVIRQGPEPEPIQS